MSRTGLTNVIDVFGLKESCICRMGNVLGDEKSQVDVIGSEGQLRGMRIEGERNSRKRQAIKFQCNGI